MRLGGGGGGFNIEVKYVVLGEHLKFDFKIIKNIFFFVYNNMKYYLLMDSSG